MSKNKILCFGTINPDLIYFIDSIPQPGGDIRSKDYQVRVGGTAINCAEKIVEWGFDAEIRGNSIGKDSLGNYVLEYADSNNIFTGNVLRGKINTPTCSILVDETGERTIISSGYSNLEWSNFQNLENFYSLIIDRYSIKFIGDQLKKVKSQFPNLFILQAGFETEINYVIDFLVVSKDEITVQKTEELINRGLVKNILLTSSNLPARLISQEGAIEIVPPDFKTINANGAGDTTAAYIGAFGTSDLLNTIKEACAAGAIVAGTTDFPDLVKIKDIAKLVEVKPR